MNVGLIARAAIMALLQMTSIAIADAPAFASYLPRGSFALSCRHIHVDGPFLEAVCTRVDGSWHYTRIFLPRCDSDQISNQNGHLTCGG